MFLAESFLPFELLFDLFVEFGLLLLYCLVIDAEAFEVVEGGFTETICGGGGRYVALLMFVGECAEVVIFFFECRLRVCFDLA